MPNLRHIWQKHFHLWLYVLVDEAERLYRLRIYDEQTPDYVGCNVIGRVREPASGGAFLDIGNNLQAFMRKLPKTAKIGDLLPLTVDRHLPNDKGLRVALGWHWQLRYGALTTHAGRSEINKEHASLWENVREEVRNEIMPQSDIKTAHHRLQILPSLRRVAKDEQLSALRQNLVALAERWAQAEKLLADKTCRPQILPSDNFLQKALLEMPPIAAPVFFTSAGAMKAAEAALQNCAPDLCGDFSLAKHEVNPQFIQAEWRGLLDSPYTFGEGARLFIDETAAATIIDLDSAGQTGGGDFLSLNLQAAEEVMRFIGALDLAGVILVDFIRMKNPQDRRRLHDRLKTLSKRLALSCDILGYSRSGFVEILRRRHRLSLRQNGAQNAVSAALIELSLAAQNYKHGTLQLTADKRTLEFLQKHHSDILNSLPVRLKSDEAVRFAIVENL